MYDQKNENDESATAVSPDQLSLGFSPAFSASFGTPTVVNVPPQVNED